MSAEIYSATTGRDRYLRVDDELFVQCGRMNPDSGEKSNSIGIRINAESAAELIIALGEAIMGADENVVLAEALDKLYEQLPGGTPGMASVEIESRQVTATQDATVEYDVEPSMHGSGVYIEVFERGGAAIDSWLTEAEADALIEAIQWAKGVSHGDERGMRTVEVTAGTPSDEAKDAFIAGLLGGEA